MSSPETARRQADLDKMAEQDRRLQLPRLDAELAWTLGTRLRDLALARQVAVTIEIRIGNDLVFFHAMRGTAPANADWARRKRNISELLDRSSYQVGVQHSTQDTSVEEKMGLPVRDYAPHGGAVPLRVGGTRLGTVTVSGLPQRDDHDMVVEVLADLCGVPLAEVALAR
jgi:uncharacterized protein (UPF0303 family)